MAWETGSRISQLKYELKQSRQWILKISKLKGKDLIESVMKDENRRYKIGEKGNNLRHRQKGSLKKG